MTDKLVNFEIEGRKCDCWFEGPDLHALFEDGEIRVYHHANVLKMGIDFAEHPAVAQDIIFRAVPE